MTVISRNAFWRAQSGLVQTFPTLRENLNTEVLIIGGGISGALIAHEMVSKGFQTTLIERAEIGAGSTSGSTALIQYEIDSSMATLEKLKGQESAEQAYQCTFAATQKIRALAKELNLDSLREKDSFYLASKKSEIKDLQAEALRRKKVGLPVEFVGEDEIGKKFPFSRPGALRSKNVFELDPYLFTHSLIKSAQSKGLQVFDRTKCLDFSCEKTGIKVKIENDLKIHAKKLIFAVGYEAANYLPRNLFQLHSTFALISKPVKDFSGWHEQSQIWETKRPYLYLRTTADNRALIGGLDEKFSKSWLRDRLLPKKSAQLLTEFKKFFPAIEFLPDYSWAGTFGETKDSLPYIGNLKKYSNVYFSCGFGGNGITFSALAAELLAKELKGIPSPSAKIFSFDR